MSAMQPHAELILDGTKLGWHLERVRAWERGERVAPITVDMALTRACNYACHFCYAMLQENERHPMTGPVVEAFLTDAAAIGVRGVSLVSDGESTLSPVFVDAVVRGSELGLSMACGTKVQEFEEFLRCGRPEHGCLHLVCRDPQHHHIREVVSGSRSAATIVEFLPGPAPVPGRAGDRRATLVVAGIRPAPCVDESGRDYSPRVGLRHAREVELALRAPAERAVHLSHERAHHLGAELPVVAQERAKAPGQRADPVPDGHARRSRRTRSPHSNGLRGVAQEGGG
ncbi:MAG: hypothetical protein KF718_07785 [Polyangiaceae bacterium]|nr:hypothetical protein [Polyangiaceae bacterium]